MLSSKHMKNHHWTECAMAFIENGYWGYMKSQWASAPYLGIRHDSPWTPPGFTPKSLGFMAFPMRSTCCTACPHAACLGFTTSAEHRNRKHWTWPHFLGGFWFRLFFEFKHISRILWILKLKNTSCTKLSMQFSRRWENGHTRRSQGFFEMH